MALTKSRLGVTLCLPNDIVEDRRFGGWFNHLNLSKSMNPEPTFLGILDFYLGNFKEGFKKS